MRLVAKENLDKDDDQVFFAFLFFAFWVVNDYIGLLYLYVIVL